MNPASSTGPAYNGDCQKSQFKIPYLDRGKYLLQSGLYADCEFLVGNGTEKEVYKTFTYFSTLKTSPNSSSLIFYIFLL